MFAVPRGFVSLLESGRTQAHPIRGLNKSLEAISSKPPLMGSPDAVSMLSQVIRKQLPWTILSLLPTEMLSEVI